MNQGNPIQNQNTDPTQDALRWIAQALDDHKASLQPAAREAYVLRAQAALQQVQIALLPRADAVQDENAAPVPIKRGRKLNGHAATKPVDPSANA